MNLDDMSIDDIRTLIRSLAVIQRAADALGGLTGLSGGEVRISLQPGQPAVLATGWAMPACGCEIMADLMSDLGPVVIEDEPRDVAAHGMAGGSGGLQCHCSPETPPAEPAASPPETGEIPEAIPRAEAQTGEAATAADPVWQPVPNPPARVSTVSNPEPWTQEDEDQLVALVAGRLAAGDTRKAALDKASVLMGRTASACDFRLRSRLEDRLRAAVDHQRKENAKRAEGLAKVVAAAPEKPPAQAEVAVPAAEAPTPTPAAQSSLTMTQRTILDTIRKLAGRKGFDPEIDLEIVEGFARGTKTAALALDLDLDAALLLARFRDLTACIRDHRGNMSIDGQADVLKVLRLLVQEARGVAA